MADTKQLGIRFPADKIEALEQLAEQNDINGLSDLIRIAVAEFATRHDLPMTPEDLGVGKWGGRRVVLPLEGSGGHSGD